MSYTLMTLETFFILLIAELPYLLICIGIGYLATKIFKKQFNSLLNSLFDETDDMKRDYK